MAEEKTDLVPVAAIPRFPLAELKELTDYVAQVKATLMTKDKDYVIQRGKQYTTRSGFAKLAQGFLLSDEVVKEERLEKDGEFYGFNFTVRVFNDHGRRSTGVGSCTMDEPNVVEYHKERPYHDCRSIAYTRAYNRAVSNFVGSADVSAEELSYEPGRKLVDVGYGRGDEDEGIELPEDFNIPEWTIPDEISMQGWEKIDDIIGAYLQHAGFQKPTEHFEWGHDIVKAWVKNKGYFGEAYKPVNELLVASGFHWVKNENRWRLKKPEDSQ